MAKLDKEEKYKRVRLVTFKADYAPGSTGRVIYEKDSQHAIPIETVDKIKKNGASVSVEKFDLKEEEEERAEAFRKAEKERAKDE